MSDQKTMEVANRKNTGSKKKLSLGFLLAWPTRTISFGVASVLITYTTLYATDYMGLSVGKVGLVFIIAKIFDGITDFIAGALIDRTRTKLGKARPYELALIGYWASLVLMFSAPAMSEFAGLLYLFVMYSVSNSVFVTLLNCGEPVYLANALEDRSKSVVVAAVAGFIGLIFTVAASMLIPQLITSMGAEKTGWTMISLILAVPMTLIGLVRFFVIKERYNSGAQAGQKLSLREMVTLLGKNKYILLVTLMIFFGNLGTNMNAGQYFFIYILGDLGLMSIMSLSMLSIVFVMILIPIFSKKFGIRRCIQACVLLGVAGFLIKLIDITNVGLLFVSSMLGGLTFAASFAFINTFCIDCMDYGEWKNGKRSEGMVSCIQSIGSKIGGAAGAGMIGILMGISGYVSGGVEQPQSSLNMIIGLNTVIPALIGVIIFVILQFYDLDKKLPGIRADLKAREDGSAKR
jgi:GPH family glycoside/pentoside/hexuronide:cation symporter